MFFNKFLFIIFLFCIKRGDAQVEPVLKENNSRFIVSFSTGLAIPIGEFSYFEPDLSYPIQVNIAGIAKTGFEGRLSLIYMFSKHFGINVTVLGTVNPSKRVDEEDLFYSHYGNIFVVPGIHNFVLPTIIQYRTPYSYSTKPWHTINFLSGLVYSIKDGNKNFHLRIDGGLQLAQSPETKLVENRYGFIWFNTQINLFEYELTTVQQQITSNSFVFDIGMDVGLSLTKDLEVLLNFDYLSSSASFSGEKKTNYFSPSNPLPNISYLTTPISFSKTVGLFCIGIGVNYSF